MFLAVHPDHRRRGIARLLTVATFQATGAARMDLITDEANPFLGVRGIRVPARYDGFEGLPA